MKKIIFLFIIVSQAIGFSQKNQTDDSYIIFSRLYEEPDDGPCNLFINDDSSGFGISSKKIKCTSNLIDDFKKLKSKSYKWKIGSDFCSDRCIGCLRIENQLILKSGTYLDTIYFNSNEYEKLIIDYNGNSYLDKKDDIYKTLSKNKEVKDFFVAPIRNYYKTIYDFEQNKLLDSIDVNNIKLKNFVIYGKNVKTIDSIIKFETLTYIETLDRLYNTIEIQKEHVGFNFNNNSNNYFYFEEKKIIKKISFKIIDEIYERYNNQGYIELLGLKIGDNHEKMKERFPNSSRHIENISEYFKDKNGIYHIEIPFIENKGNVNYSFKEGKIVAIEIEFY